MKITFIGHAVILIEANGLRILSDPWWQGPCFGNEWWIYPRPYLAALDRPVDYIYVSHGHADHFHRGTLRRFAQGTKVLVSTEVNLAPALREMGFETIEVRPDREHDLGSNVRCRIMPTQNADTLMGITDGNEVCLNLNDALHATARDVQDRVCDHLRAVYPRIDYVFCGYGIASHFPNCFVIPEKDGARTAAARQHYFNQQWVHIINRLQPRFGFPFAANVAFLSDDLMWSNEPTANSERPTDLFLALPTQAEIKVVDIAPGFAVANGAIVDDARFQPVATDDIRREYAEAIEQNASRAERTSDGAELLKERLEHNIAVSKAYLEEFPGNYRFLLTVRDRTWALEIVKDGRDISVAVVDGMAPDPARYDIEFKSYFSYLRRSFTTDFGNETLFVGSGILIEYMNRQRVAENLHRELTVLLAKLDKSPRSRFGDQPKWIYCVKNLVKRLIGRVEPDLYDLNTWTRFA